MLYHMHSRNSAITTSFKFLAFFSTGKRIWENPTKQSIYTCQHPKNSGVVSIQGQFDRTIRGNCRYLQRNLELYFPRALFEIPVLFKTAIFNIVAYHRNFSVPGPVAEVEGQYAMVIKPIAFLRD